MSTMQAKPSTTINRIHFTDLDPLRFEDLCLSLIYPLHPWIELRHYGRTGSDEGVDIYSREILEDNSQREWFIQCKRYKKATANTLKKTVTDALDRMSKPPDVLLVVLACDVSKKAQESYITYASDKGVGTPLLWTSSIIEAQLHCERRDLLFSFFGISEVAEARQRESVVTRNLAMKRRLHSALLKEASEVDTRDIIRKPQARFNTSTVIIHSIDDSLYPSMDSCETGISGWFKLQVWDFYFNGLEFLARVCRAIIDSDGNWTVIEHRQEFDEATFHEIRVYHLLRLPYRNIVEIDMLGDEYFGVPHLYCRFSEGGEPYEGARYVMAETDCHYTLEDEKRFVLRSPEEA
jgi:hypothetical protein